MGEKRKAARHAVARRAKAGKRKAEFFAHLFVDCAEISERISRLKDQYFHIACKVAYALMLVTLAT